MPCASRVDSIDAILRESLADPELTLVSGHWPDGAIMEMVPRGRALLSAPRYGGAFAGLRDLHLEGEAHHMHLDLARLPCATYVLVPSVCFGFQPSFELRLSRAHDEALERFGLGLSISAPYRAGRLRHEAVGRYFQRLIDHQERFPESVSFCASSICAGQPVAASFDWEGLGGVLKRLTGLTLGDHSTQALSSLIASLRSAGACS